MDTMFKFLAVATLAILSLPPTACNNCKLTQVACDGICAEACDGFVECSNKEDESRELCSNIPCVNSASLPVGDLGNFGDIFDQASSDAGVEFKCGYGGCIPKTFTCNGHRDCWDATDETQELCSSRKCKRREFRCDYGACIRRLWTCNGLVNCMDGSDETATLCKNKICSSSKFKCNYGGCIDANKKCNGIIECNDSSDESKTLCGANHNVIDTTSPTTTLAPVTQPLPPPSVVTQSPTPVTPEIIPVGPDPPKDPCSSQGRCPCPNPNAHFCVPCNDMGACERIAEVGVCSTETPGGPDTRVSIDVLSCGTQPVLNLAVFVRKDAEFVCGSGNAVPVLSVVTADCWGTTILAECHADGRWHSYGSFHNTTLPSRYLCQPQGLNSPLCGSRPRYAPPSGIILGFERKPSWPWLVGMFKRGKYSCTATIISSHYLLTAAHCLTRTQESSKETVDVRNLKIQRLNHLGELDIETEFVNQVHLYPGYRGGLRPSNDLALVRVDREIIFSEEVYPACVHTAGFPQNKLAATFSRATKEYQWELILQQYDPRCHSPHDRCSTTLQIREHQFCGIDIAMKRSLPRGSSGGPYLVNTGNDAEERWAVAGVVSASRTENSCPHPYTVFTDMHNFWSWIDRCVRTGVCT